MLAKNLIGAAVAAVAATPTFVSSSVSRQSATNSNAVTAPAGIQDGDLLVAVGFNVGNTITGITPPTGFSVIHFDDAAANTFFLATKTAASEPGTYDWTWTGTASNNAIAILVYRNATRVNTLGANTRASATTGTAASITPTFRDTLCAVFANEQQSNVTTAPAGLTQRVLQNTVNSPSLAVYDLASQEAAATSAYSLVWATAGQLSSIQLFVTNEPDVTPVFVASATGQPASAGTNLSINVPTGTVSGDLMIAVMGGDGGTAVTWTSPAGWTEVADQGGGVKPGVCVSYRVAGSSEPASYTFVSSANSRSAGTILTYRYAAYDTIAGAFTASANPLGLASVSPTQSQSLLLAVGFRDTANITLGTPTSMTARVTKADAVVVSYIVAEQAVAKGPTGTRSMSTGSTSNVAGIMLAIKPTRSL